eukprot:jgi/Tetstr1/441777/TSEL_029994.t1
MGWSLSPFYFTTFTMTTFVKHLRSPTIPAAPGNVPRSCRWLRRGRWRGARILPYVDDFLMFASSEPEALEPRLRVAALLDILSMQRNPAKKELKAVRPAVESFPPHLAGCRVLLHEDNRAVCNVLAGLTSRSPEMMAELRKLWYLLNSNGVHIRARYTRSAVNVWADRLSRHLDSDDWQLDPVLFAELEVMWGAHPVDRFVSALNEMLPRYNVAWLDPGCEAADSFHLSDAEWRRENNYRNSLPDLCRSRARAARPLPSWPLAGRVRCGTMHLPIWRWRSAWYCRAAIFPGRGGGQGAICPERRARQ